MTSSTGSPAMIRRIAGAIGAAFVSALVAHLATVLVFFTASGADATSFSQLGDYFLPSALLLFLLIAVVAGFDGLRRWYAAIPLGILVAVLAGLFGSLITVINGGSTLDGAAIAFVFGTLVGPKLVFVIAAVVATATVGRRLWSLVTGSKLDVPPARDRRIALVRLPAANLAEGQVTHIARSVVDAEKADEQWDNYVAALIEHGWDTIEVPVAAEAPDSVFVEDTVVIFGDTAVITSPGHETRRGETAGVEDTVRELGLRIARIDLPGTLDGGDVLKVGRTVYVGRGGRTNAEGIRQLRAIVAPLGYTVIAVPVTRVLHLKSGVTALPDGTVIGYPPLVDNPELFDRFLGVPEETGVAVVVLDDDTVLMAESAPKSAALISDLGYTVVTVDISEFEKLEGCVTCLSVRIR
ncbi:MAG TPA: dimethylarginine dimethylaminohydrolase [Terrimesophilobacter sp.]|nr:dimethylarginine dimethylaminohydrolase [Terrimesophilobacter sp.]